MNRQPRRELAPQRLHPALIARQRREPCIDCGADLAGRTGRIDTPAGPRCSPRCLTARAGNGTRLLWEVP